MAALAVGVGLRMAPAVTASDAVQGIGQAARDKGCADPDLFSAVPPVGSPGVENILRGWLRSSLFALVRFRDLYFAVQAFFFSSEGSCTG